MPSTLSTRAKVTSAAGTTNRPSIPEARPRGDDDLVDLGAAQHLPLVAAQHPAVAVAGGGGADAEGIPAPAFVEGEGAVELTGGHPRQESAHLGQGPGLPHGRDELRHRGQEGTRSRRPAQLLEHHRQLHEAPTEAAEVDVDGERRPAQPAELAAEALGFSAADGYLPDQPGRALTGEDCASAVAELQLLVRELEVHDVPLLS